ncbi:hypothetical protein EBR77_04530 [bacterium]|nr:hypothetical protein [bacterium]NBX78001.1 hypothetical protein [bacterium]
MNHKTILWSLLISLTGLVFAADGGGELSEIDLTTESSEYHMTSPGYLIEPLEGFLHRLIKQGKKQEAFALVHKKIAQAETDQNWDHAFQWASYLDKKSRSEYLSQAEAKGCKNYPVLARSFLKIGNKELAAKALCSISEIPADFVEWGWVLAQETEDSRAILKFGTAVKISREQEFNKRGLTPGIIAASLAGIDRTIAAFDSSRS